MPVDLSSYARLLIHAILMWSSNLIDAANIAALAALLTSRRPECSLGGENGQDVVIHPPEVIKKYSCS